MAIGTLNLIGQSTEQLTMGVPTNLAFPSGTPPGSTIYPHHALITVEGNAVRWGASPTTLNGTLVPVGGTIDFTSTINDYRGVLMQMKFIALVGNATLQVQWFD